jgi:hypothetical protein
LVDKNSPVADSQKRDLQQRIDLIDGKVEQWKKPSSLLLPRSYTWFV